MAFRQVARVTGKFSVFWPEWLEVTFVSEDDAPEIGDFLLRLGHPLRPECQPSTLDGATYYFRRRLPPNQSELSSCPSVLHHRAPDRKRPDCRCLPGGRWWGWRAGIWCLRHSGRSQLPESRYWCQHDQEISDDPGRAWNPKVTSLAGR